MNLAEHLPDGAINPHVKETYRNLEIISYQIDTQPEYVEGFAVNLPQNGKPRVVIIGPARNDEFKQKFLLSARRMIDNHLDR